MPCVKPHDYSWVLHENHVKNILGEDAPYVQCVLSGVFCKTYTN